MASILDFLNTEKGTEFIDKASAEVNESPSKVKSALAMALPMLVGAMKKNVSTSEGAAALNSALEEDKHDGSILDKISSGNLSSFMGEGSGILQHLLGGKQSKISEAVAAAVGMDSAKIEKILKMAAPVVMGLIGKQKRKDSVNSSEGLSGLVGSVMGSNSSHDQSLLESLMSSDKEGITKNAMGKIFGNKGDSKGLGGFFKG